MRSQVSVAWTRTLELSNLQMGCLHVLRGMVGHADF